MRQVDRPLQGLSHQLAASATWRRAFYGYLAVLHLWVFYVLHHI